MFTFLSSFSNYNFYLLLICSFTGFEIFSLPSERQSKSPGIRFVPPRAGTQPSKFIGQCNPSLVRVQNLLCHKVLDYQLLKEFILYLIQQPAEQREDLQGEVEAVSLQGWKFFVVVIVKSWVNKQAGS